MSPADVLRAATLSAAEFLGLETTIGSVTVGTRADLLLLDGNPLDDLSRTRAIHAVILGGQYLSRERLQRLTADAARAAMQPLPKQP